MLLAALATGALALLTAIPAWAADELTAEQARPRVAHHLREAGGLARHFEGVLAAGCPRFATAEEFDAYLDAELDRVVLLLAHLEEAWAEAKRTGDDDVRREAKAPRRQVERAHALLDKLQGCAGEHGRTIAPMSAWRRVEREVPRRQAAIALPR
jgi:hypothetical protein